MGLVSWNGDGPSKYLDKTLDPVDLYRGGGGNLQVNFEIRSWVELAHFLFPREREELWDVFPLNSSSELIRAIESHEMYYCKVVLWL